MGSVTPRASGFWDNRMGYFNDEEEDPQNGLDPNDPRSSLDKTIDRIGMGTYQWTLLSLCGFGWMADNMWIQAVAIILPRVQQHYSVPDSYIGTVSSSMFAGMMFGAVGWGTCSDLMGRITAFNLTLFFTSLFGILAAFSTSFPMLCIILFLLGSSVGGSMPTDGTLLLENMPKGKEYLVTALSVFFSFGSVLSAVVALLLVPQHSCKATSLACDVNADNQGWKYLLMTLGAITLFMFIARIVFFTLHESPRYLVHAGRPQEAIEALQLISRFNGSELSLDLEDVDDQHPVVSTNSVPSDQVPFLHQEQPQKSPTEQGEQVRPSLHAQSSSAELRSSFVTNGAGYQSTTSSDLSPKYEEPDNQNGNATNPLMQPEDAPLPRATPRPSLASRRNSRRLSSVYEKKRVCSALPRVIRRPMLAWLDRIALVLSPEWLRTTLLVWAVWCAMSLAFTMFNVYLPKLLESGAGGAAKSLEDSLWDVVIFTIGGCPGAILGAYLIESPLGRRWALAGSTFITAFFCVVFITVKSPLAVRASSVGISLSATAMWAVLYGWTPEIFGTKVRGTACGIASALSRVGGMIAPMLGGILLVIDRSVPVYTSVAIFIIAGVCVLFLEEDAGNGQRNHVVSVGH